MATYTSVLVNALDAVRMLHTLQNSHGEGNLTHEKAERFAMATKALQDAAQHIRILRTM